MRTRRKYSEKADEEELMRRIQVKASQGTANIDIYIYCKQIM
jgi:hypothetical protein